MIDPGHGGHDPGAVRGSVKESEIALDVSKKLAELLKKDVRFNVSMTRFQDQFVPLDRRVGMSFENKVDLLISIHVNASYDRRAKGAEFYFQNQLKPDEESLFLADRENHFLTSDDTGPFPLPPGQDKGLSHDVKNMIEDMARSYRIYQSSLLSESLHHPFSSSGQTRSHAIRQAPFYLVTKVGVPSALVELGFLSHKGERALLQNQKYRHNLAYKLYRGLIKYKERLDNPGRSSLQERDAPK